MLYTDKNIDFNASEFKCSNGSYGSIDKNDSAIFKKFYLYESLKLGKIKDNTELSKFICYSGSNSTIWSNMILYIIVYIMSCIVIGFYSYILSNGNIILSVILFSFSFLIGIYCTKKMYVAFFNNDYTLYKKFLFNRLTLKIEIKEILEGYNELLKSNISKENKKDVRKIFDILNSSYDFDYLLDNYDVCKKHITLLNEDNELAKLTGKYILEVLELHGLQNLIQLVSTYFDIIEDNKSKINEGLYNAAKSLNYTWKNLDDDSFVMAKSYKIFTDSQLYDIIILGCDLDKFCYDTITDKKVEYFNKHIKEFFEIYEKEKTSLMNQLYNINIYDIQTNGEVKYD